MIVKQLNGDLFEIEFDRPNQTIFDICKSIWDFQKMEFEKEKNEEEKNEEKPNKYFNHFVFENEEGEKITIDQFNPSYDFTNKDELFVSNKTIAFFNSLKGHDRQIDTSIFSLCNAFFFPKKADILVYCAGKDAIRCIDLNDFSFHVDASLVSVKDPFGYHLVGKNGKLVNNDQIKTIDRESFLSYYPNTFKSGIRVFEDTGTKIECYLSRVITGFKPTYIARDGSGRSHYNYKKIIEYCTPLPEPVTKSVKNVQNVPKKKSYADMARR